MKTEKGKLIVIDGTDGSGKGTQAELLMQRLRMEQQDAVLFDFPRYGKPAACGVEKYLRGEYGAAEEVGPYAASMLYAFDRFDAALEMRTMLACGTLLVSNRYTSSNMGHQAGKITDLTERDVFLAWLKELEYGQCKIPVPDVNILLYVPPEVGQRLVGEKKTRAYTQGKTHDIHEADLDHLRKASEAYRYVAEREGWKIIDCIVPNTDTLRTKEDIHQEIWDYLQSLNIL